MRGSGGSPAQARRCLEVLLLQGWVSVKRGAYRGVAIEMEKSSVWVSGGVLQVGRRQGGNVSRCTIPWRCWLAVWPKRSCVSALLWPLQLQLCVPTAGLPFLPWPRASELGALLAKVTEGVASARGNCFGERGIGFLLAAVGCASGEAASKTTGIICFSTLL